MHLDFVTLHFGVFRRAVVSVSEISCGMSESHLLKRATGLGMSVATLWIIWSISVYVTSYFYSITFSLCNSRLLLHLIVIQMKKSVTPAVEPVSHAQRLIIKGSSFGDEIQNQNFKIYDINDVIIRTQKF